MGNVTAISHTFRYRIKKKKKDEERDRWGIDVAGEVGEGLSKAVTFE